GDHALSLLPEDEISSERGSLLGWQAKSLMLRGKHTKAIRVAREALRVADALGDRHIRGRALNALGTALMGLGKVDEGAAALREAELALGRGEHVAARALLDEAARVGADIDEPQFTGVLGALRAELERRVGDLGAARRAVQDALDRIETCTDDAARLARVSA